MDLISFYNPLKTYKDKKHIYFLDRILENVTGQICFVGDENGYFFSPFRRKYRPHLFLQRPIFINFFQTFQKENPRFLKKMFTKYNKSFSFELAAYAEKQVTKENFAIVNAFYLMALSNLSDGFDSSLANYNRDNFPFFIENIDKLGRYFIDNIEIFTEKIPDNCFCVSYEQPLKSEGVLITKRSKNLELLGKIDRLNYYYWR